MALEKKENQTSNFGIDAGNAAGAAGMLNNPLTEDNTAFGILGTGLGFGTKPIFTMNANQGSDYTLGFANAMTESYKQLPSGVKPKVSVLDKETIGGLAYSAVIVSQKDKDTVLYYTVLLEGTGRKSMKAAEIMAELLSAQKTQSKPYAYTTDDAIDSVLHGEAVDALKKEYQNQGVKTYIPVDGVVVPAIHDELTILAPKVAAIAFNACIVDAALGNGEIKDLNIAHAKKQAKKLLKIESTMNAGTAKNEVGKPVRSDFTLTLNANDMNNNFTSLNSQNQNITLTKVTGYVDALPEEVAIPSMPGMPVTTQIRLRPLVVLTSDAVFAPTTNYALLGIISSLVMTQPNMWVPALMPNSYKRQNTGALNLLTNLESNQNRIGSVLDIGGKSTKPDEAYALLKQMFALSPVIAMDIATSGPETFYTSIIGKAAEQGNSEGKIAAARELIASANWLTDGNFPADFPLNEIFAHNAVVIPNGVWADKSGERDIRDIDLAFIATNNGDINMMNKWAITNLPKEFTQIDPYFAKVDAISKIIPDAEITGKSLRVTFSAKFITTLSNAAIAAGLDVSFAPEITFAENTSISIMAGYLGAAGVNNASGFARQHVVAGPNFQAGYGSMGYGRF